MEQSYLDTAFCDKCEDGTDHAFYDAGHERDSSNDWQQCLNCKAVCHGITGRYEECNELRLHSKSLIENKIPSIFKELMKDYKNLSVRIDKNLGICLEDEAGIKVAEEANTPVVMDLNYSILIDQLKENQKVILPLYALSGEEFSILKEGEKYFAINNNLKIELFFDKNWYFDLKYLS